MYYCGPWQITKEGRLCCYFTGMSCQPLILYIFKKKWNTQHVYPLGTDLSVKGAESQLKKRRNLHNEVKYTLIHLNTLLFKPAAYVQMWNAGKHNQSRSVSSCTGRSEDGWICRSSAVSPLAALLCDPLDIRRRDMTILTCLSPSSFCVDPAVGPQRPMCTVTSPRVYYSDRLHTSDIRLQSDCNNKKYIMPDIESWGSKQKSKLAR
jgi:hypothetical protein